MYQISRIYIANAGYRLAWYPGLLLPFTDDKTDLPTQAIYNLANQGGKTTFLALVFSIFDTSQDRFLQTLANPAQHFVDYFDKDGLPGIIVVEWDMPSGDMVSPRKRLVTGQLVCLRKSGDGSGWTPDRYFFSFTANDALSLQDIPGPNLSGGQRGELRSREDCVRWLHETTQANKGNFQYLANQTDWKDLLTSSGLDVELLHNQVDFNRKEGGMDEAFLDFKSEYDFVRRFLLLTLDPIKAHDTQQLVASLCRKMAGRKELLDALAQMQKLSIAFQPFAKAAEEYQAAMAARETAARELGIADATLDVHIAQRSEQAETQTAIQRTKEAELAEQANLASAAEADTEALESERLGRESRQAQDLAEAADKRHMEAQRRLLRVGAAELQGEIIGLQTEVDGLERALAEANQGTAPLRQSVGEKAALYRRMLVDLADVARTEATELKKSAALAKQAEKQHEERRDAARRERQAALTTQTQANTRLTDADARRSTLIRECILRDDEQASAAVERVTAEITAIAAGIARFEDEAVTHDINGKAFLANALAREQEIKPVQHEFSLLSKEVEEGESTREALVHNRALAKAAGAEICNPDSEVLPGRAAELQRQEQGRWRDSELELSRLREGQASFDQTSLFGRDPDVVKVVRFLSDHGVAGTRAYADYIANTVPKAVTAREVALSNPGRYLGVAVPEPKDVAASKDLLDKAFLGLVRPVIVSTYDSSVEPSKGAVFVVGPADDSLWNKEAAAKRAMQLAGLIEIATSAADAAEKAANNALVAKTELNKYVAQFGEGKLTRLRAKVKGLGEQLTAAEQQISQMRQHAEDEASAARRDRAEASRLQKTEMPKVTSHLQALTGYLNDWESKRPAWQQQLLDATAAVLAAETAESSASAGMTKEHETFEEANRRAKSRDEAAVGYDEVCNGLSRADETFDVEAELKSKPRALPEMASEYEIALTALRAAESKTTAHLVGALESKGKQLKAKRGEYGRRYPAERFPMSEIGPMVGSNYRELERIAQSQVEQEHKNQIDAAGAVADVSARLNAHQKQQKHPDHIAADAASLNAEDLASTIERRRSDSKRATQFALEAKGASIAARNLVRELNRQLELYKGQRQALAGQSLDFSEAQPDASRFADVGTVAEEVGRLLLAHSTAKIAVETTEKRAGRALEVVTKLAMDETFSRADVEIAAMLLSNSLENSAADVSRIQTVIGSRIDSLNHDLSKMDEDFANATNALMALVGVATKIMRHAVERLKLPDNVPIVGGKSVFKMRTAVFSMSQEQKRPVLAAYMEELAADGNIPETGAQLAAQALMRLADNKLGLTLLKIVEIEEEQYVSVEKLTHSGSEKLSMALFLYFITMRLRYEEQPAASRAENGALLLDNPFAKATLRPIWVAIHSLAEAMKVQLIIATGMNEPETLSVFKRHLRLGRTQINNSTGRIHVKVTDFQVLPGPDKVAA